MRFKNALVIRFGGLGDILMTTPILPALVHKFPDLQIDYIVGARMGEVLAGNSHVRVIIEFDKQAADRSCAVWRPLLADIRKCNYDLVINLHPSLKSAAIVAASGAREVVTFRKDMRLQKTTGKRRHATDDFAHTLHPLGIGELPHIHADFRVHASSMDRVDFILATDGVRWDDRIVVLNPHASRAINRWPADRFMAVAKHFASMPHTKVVVTGAPRSFNRGLGDVGELSAAELVATAHPGLINLAACLTINELGALLLRASVFLTGDTGLMHMAGALDVPTVALYGPSDADRTAPRLRSTTVVSAMGDPRCVPCSGRSCARGDLACMHRISTQTVIAALEQRLPSGLPTTEQTSYNLTHST